MVNGIAAAIGTWALLAGPWADRDAVELRERGKPGQVTRFVLSLKAEGKTLPPLPPGKPGSQPLPLKVEGRCEGWEKLLEVDATGVPMKAARSIQRAAAAINSELRPTTTALRQEVSLLLAERREGATFLMSPGGPLTRQELEVVQWPADPMALALLLPARAVKVGDRWEPGAEGARSLSGYDALASNGLSATLEALDEASARIKIAGKVRGATLGAEGEIDCDGTLWFDRREARVRKLELRRTEDRKPGQVEAGLDVRSVLVVSREPAETPAELADAALAGVVNGVDRSLELLRFSPPGGGYTLYHDRDWHLSYDDARKSVLKRLDHGELVAQCNLSIGPNAGKDRHQDPRQFQEDVRAALGNRFGKVLLAGPVEEPRDGLFRFRMVVQGQVEQVGVIWIYYLIANPDGDQLLATFTMAQAQAERFGEQDLGMIGSLSWPGSAAAGADRPRGAP
ncbi:MAG: hypothetical protein U0800_23285 [Isosphaeraceae bacterium]